MKFVVDYVSKCSSAGRLGTLTKTDNISLKTPTFLHYTKAASIPYLSREVFNNTSDNKINCGYQISVDTTYNMLDSCTDSQMGITKFASLESNDQQSCISCLTVKNPGEQCVAGHHEQELLPIFTRFGKRTLSAEMYMKYVESFCPDIFHGLCDGDTNEDSSKKRTLKSTERTEQFMKICWEKFKSSDKLKNSMFIAPIEGGYSLKSREHTIEEMKPFNVDGYFIDGFHNNGQTASLLEFPNIEQILGRCLELLPTEKIRLMFGAYSPIMILELIRIGIDLFDSSYPYLATVNNCALTFRFCNDDENKNPDLSYDLYLGDEKYKFDLTPISADCNCLSCKNHTKAYIYHLISTKELLAPILLSIHNIHHYEEFFKYIRQSIVDGRLEELINVVRNQYDKGSQLIDQFDKNNNDEKDNDSIKSKTKKNNVVNVE